MRYEYQVVPAPTKGEKARGIRTGTERFALALASVMNRMGRDGWEYVRAESLPAEQKSGLLRTTTALQHVLVFRRPLPDDVPGTGATLAVANAPTRPLANAPEGASRPVGPAV